MFLFRYLYFFFFIIKCLSIVVVVSVHWKCETRNTDLKNIHIDFVCALKPVLVYACWAKMNNRCSNIDKQTNKNNIINQMTQSNKPKKRRKNAINYWHTFRNQRMRQIDFEWEYNELWCRNNNLWNAIERHPTCFPRFRKWMFCTCFFDLLLVARKKNWWCAVCYQNPKKKKKMIKKKSVKR